MSICRYLKLLIHKKYLAKIMSIMIIKILSILRFEVIKKNTL
jgi:hypothetical protein